MQNTKIEIQIEHALVFIMQLSWDQSLEQTNNKCQVCVLFCLESNAGWLLKAILRRNIWCRVRLQRSVEDSDKWHRAECGAVHQSLVPHTLRPDTLQKHGLIMFGLIYSNVGHKTESICKSLFPRCTVLLGISCVYIDHGTCSNNGLYKLTITRIYFS